MNLLIALLLIGGITIGCILYHIYSFHRSEAVYQRCEDECHVSKECQTSTNDNLNCEPYYQCVDKCKE
jgi:hypothetical protein